MSALVAGSRAMRPAVSPIIPNTSGADGQDKPGRDG
jgi:hypothetical protein